MDETPPSPARPVVLGAAGAATPESPDPVTSGDIDVQWAMTFDLGTSETGRPDSDGAKATGQVDDGPESRDGDSEDT